MVRDIAVAALAGPGLVLGLAVSLDVSGVLALEGLVQRLSAVLSVVLAVLVFAWLQRRREREDLSVPGPGDRPVPRVLTGDDEDSSSRAVRRTVEAGLQARLTERRRRARDNVA